MKSLLQNIADICVLLAATELVGRLCSKNAAVKFVRALAVLVLLDSAIMPLFSVEWDLSQPLEKTEQTGEALSDFVQEQTAGAAESELTAYLEGLLASAGLKAEKIAVGTDIGADNCIVLTKLEVSFAYESDSQRARALLENTLGDGVEVEVVTNGR